MRSIRFSLTVYLLALLAVALGTASVLVYRTTQSSMETRKQATEEQLRSKQAAMAAKLQVEFRASERLDSLPARDPEPERALRFELGTFPRLGRCVYGVNDRTCPRAG